MSEEATEIPVKRGPGRPRKNPVLEREPKREKISTKKWQMKAGANWETMDPTLDDTPDRLHIDPDQIPEGMSFRWVRTSSYGQPDAPNRGSAQRHGWTPVHQEDFEGRYNGRWMSKDAAGEIECEGLVLMARPAEMTEKAKKADIKKAREQVAMKEQMLTQGNLPNVTLDARHQSALNSNMISKSFERISVPEK